MDDGGWDYYDFEPDPYEELERDAEDEGKDDPAEERAREMLLDVIEADPERVYFSRQLQILLEHEVFHWITSRAIRGLVEEGKLQSETRRLATGAPIKLVWHRRYRYWKRAATAVEALVNEYSRPNIGEGLGLQGEAHVLAAFASIEFVQRGRETREYDGKVWTQSGHDVDFLFERDGRVYGVEVKNRLGYMDHEKMKVKVRVCRHIGVVPVFVVRMAPKTWIHEVQQAKGFTLVLKYQLYPWGYRELAARVRKELELPVDSPKSLREGTIRRFERWHEAQL